MAASMFCLQISPDVSTNSPLERLYNGIKDVSVQLKRRNKIAPASFVETLKLREETHHLCPYTPKGPIDNLFPGTYYLDKIDNLFRREYKRVPVSSCIDKDLSPTNSTSSSTTQSPASPIS